MPRPGLSQSAWKDAQLAPQQTSAEVLERMRAPLLDMKQQQEVIMESFAALLDELHAKPMPGFNENLNLQEHEVFENKAIGEAEEEGEEPPSPGTVRLQHLLLEASLPEVIRRQRESTFQASLEDEGIPQWKQQISKVIQDRRFDYLIGLVILINSVLIGFESQYSINEDGVYIPEWTSLIFLSIYCIEIGLRLAAFGKGNFSSYWFIFDFILVGMSLVSDLLMPLILLAQGEQGNNGLIQQVMILRMFRLFRLVRSLRMMKYLRTAWRLIYGLLASGNAMASTFGLIVLFLFIFSCAGVELITKDLDLANHPDTAWIVQYHFGSLGRIMLTLFGFVCADSVSAIYTPLIIVKPALSIYFLLLLVCISVALMNLVTAVLVEGALDQASQDKELMRHDYHEDVRKAIPKLMQIFKEHDIDGNGQLTLDEVAKVPIDSIIPNELLTDSASTMQEIFEFLDVSGDGELSQSEFVEGLLDIFTKDVPVTSVQMLRIIRTNREKLDTLAQKIDKLVMHSPRK